MNTFDLTRIRYPFSYRVSPFAEEIFRYTLHWARQQQLIVSENEKALQWIRSGTQFAARVYPFSSLDGLCAIACWITLFFRVDDDCDALPRGRKKAYYQGLVNSTLDIMQHDRIIAPGEGYTYAACFSSLWQRIRQLAHPEWLQWFMQEQEQQLRACEWEAANLDNGQAPSVATYLEMRPYFAGAYICICLIYLGFQVRLPHSVSRHPKVKQLMQLGAGLPCWANDLHSFAKELHDGDVHNLVLLLQREKQLTLAAAMEETLQVHEATLRQFLQLEQQLPSFGAAADAELRRYLHGLKALISGNHEWAVSDTRRYTMTASLAT